MAVANTLAHNDTATTTATTVPSFIIQGPQVEHIQGVPLYDRLWALPALQEQKV